MDVQYKYFLARQFRSNHAKLTPGKQSVPTDIQVMHVKPEGIFSKCHHLREKSSDGLFYDTCSVSKPATGSQIFTDI